MKTNPFVRKNMRFGAAIGLVTGIMLSLALYAKSEHAVVVVFVAFTTILGYYTPYLMYKINGEE